MPAGIGVVMVVLMIACTADGGGGATASVAPSAGLGAVPSTVTSRGRTFDVLCSPVAEALVDVKLPHETGQPFVRAITGLWDQQAIAVLANDKHGCGVWALGVASDLSPETRDAIRTEVADGVARFGVTASPVPKDPDNGMEG